MKLVKSITLTVATLVGLSAAVVAAGDVKHAKEVSWSFDGFFGRYDKASVQRGFQVYKEVCSSCHALKYFRFRNLAEVGYSEAQIKEIAKEFTVPGDLDDFGEPTERSGLPQDGYPRAFANDVAATAALGALPPDLSLMVKARHGGANYLYSILTGYDEEAPAELDLGAKAYNPYFPGGVITMAAPLSDGLVDYVGVDDEGSDGRGAAVVSDHGAVSETVDQYARDVTHFLAWVAEPALGERKAMGFRVIVFLVLMTFLLYLSKKKIWKPVKEGKNVVDGEV